jgi:hypothetical protein
MNTTGLFRKLDDDEQSEFAKWAWDNWEPMEALTDED